eukprot:3475926-Prymnesium_polylepis.1
MCRSRKARERARSAEAGQGVGREAPLQRARHQRGAAGRMCGVGAQREMLHGNAQKLRTKKCGKCPRMKPLTFSR